VKLLVDGITIGRREDGEREIRITYRFGSPTKPDTELIAEGTFVSSVKNALSYSLLQTSHWAIALLLS